MKNTILTTIIAIERAAEAWNRNPEPFLTKNEDGEQLVDALRRALPDLAFDFLGTERHGLLQRMRITKMTTATQVESRVEVAINFDPGDGAAKRKPAVTISFCGKKRPDVTVLF